MKSTSLSRQLISGVLLAELLCAALFSATAILHEMHSRRRAFDVSLRGRADSLMGAVQDAEDPEDSVIVDPTELVLPRQDVYEVVSPAGRVLGSSPGSTAAELAGLTSSSKPGYFNFQAGSAAYRAVRFEGMRVIDRDDKGGLRRPVTVLYGSPTRDLWHEAIEAARFYLATGALLLAVTGLGLVWFLREKLSPLQELAALASQVSEHSWQFEPPMSVLQTAELAPIAVSMRELLAGLRQAFERQRRLTGDAAHELKTSIAVLKSSLQLLAMSPRTTQQYMAGLEGLLQDTGRMEDLTGRMLELARLEETPAEKEGSSDLCSTLQEVAERLQPLATSKQVDLQISGESTAKLEMQPDDADILCSNLLVNALQHSPANGLVQASIQRSADGYLLTITDQGPGIPEAALPHIFERFYRADRSRSRNSGGAGLGLSICQAIIQRSHGTIQIVSVPNKGTEVSVRLPAGNPLLN